MPSRIAAKQVDLRGSLPPSVLDSNDSSEQRSRIILPTSGRGIEQGEDMKRLECFLAAATLVAAIANASAEIPEQVKIDTGMLAGTASTGRPAVRVFKGIPFAAP